MGKNRTKESLIREVANIIVHEIVAEHTNKPESVHFLQSEIIEYRTRVEKTSEMYNWNAADVEYIEKKALKLIKEKLTNKYYDVKYLEEEAIIKLNKIIKDVLY